MTISLSWLKEFIALEETPQTIADLLTGAGLEVEHLSFEESIKGGLQGLVIGQVLTCERHPNADKLSLTTVDVGGESPLSIVCGAPNVAAGQKVIVATVGTTLHPSTGESFVIKKSKIRGELSDGMLCAEDEIGLGQSHAGIMVLDTALVNGTPAAKYFGLEPEAVMEIGLTPNRADAASHLGVARDLRALLKRPIQMPVGAVWQLETEQADAIKLEVRDPQACPRYLGLVMEGVTVAPSPDWLKKKLQAIGLSSINNIVDITNYVLHGLGQPLHAFDRDQIKGDNVIVSKAEAGSLFTTLDGVERVLSGDNLMINHAEGPMCIAGVFGGKTSGINEATTRVFIESAYFAPATIRKSGQAVGLKTDASYRYERGTDPAICEEALMIAARLIGEIAGGKIASPILRFEAAVPAKTTIRASYEKLQSLIGIYLSEDEIDGILLSLDFGIKREEDQYGHMGFASHFHATVPSYKVDVTNEADLAEEVIRIYGLNNLPLSGYMEAKFLSPFPKIDPQDWQYKIAGQLAAQGFVEMLNNSIHSSEWHRTVPSLAPEKDVLLLNPLSEELNAMRRMLLFSGLHTVAYNVNRQQTDLRLFEFGKAYHQEGPGQYQESLQLALYVTGQEAAETWQQKGQPAGFYTLVNVVSQLLQKMGVDYKKQSAEVDYLNYGIQFMAKKSPLATVGLVKVPVLKPFGIKQAVFTAQIHWEEILKRYQPSLTAKEAPKFPAVRRDLSLVMDEKTPYIELERIIKQAESKLLQAINVFDVYQGDALTNQFGEGKKSYSISLHLQDAHQTLNESAIDNAMQRIIQALEKQAGAHIRKG